MAIEPAARPKPVMNRRSGGLNSRLTVLADAAQSRFGLLALAILALLLGRTPLAGNFLDWQATFFHEISHGLAAVLSGGRILKIELHFSGSGLCQTSGGIRWLISLAGYAGTAFWGLLIYLSASAIPRKHSRLPAVILAATLLAAGILYARDFQSWGVILGLALLYTAAAKFSGKAPKIFLRLAGLYVVMDALKAPSALIRHQGPNDAASLAAQTGLPDLFWIGLWILSALGVLALIWKLEKRPGERAHWPEKSEKGQER